MKNIFGVFLILFSLSSLAQNTDVVFRHYSKQQGLSAGRVISIVQDRQGFIWLGREDGLNRFDGASFITYRNNPKDSTTLSANTIRSLYVDRKGDLYIGTDQGGFNIYNQGKDNFTSFRHDPKKPNSLGSDRVMAIFEDSQGLLWLGTGGGGLNAFDRKSQKFTHFTHDPADKSSISSNFVNHVAEDKKGNLWISTDGGGVSVFDKRTKKFTTYKYSPTTESISSDFVKQVYVDKSGKIWVGTYWGGLDEYDEKTKVFNRHRFSENSINDIMEDNAGNLWLAQPAGLRIVNKKTGESVFLTSDANNLKSLMHSDIRCLLRDRTGNIWVGNEMGLDLTYGANNSFQYLKHNPKDSLSLAMNYWINGFYQDGQGTIWVRHSNGFDFFDPKKKTFTHQKNPDRMVDNNIIGLLAETDQTFWLATGRGLQFYDRQKNTYQTWMPTADSLSCPHDTWGIQRDLKGVIWLMSYTKGLFYFDREKETFHRMVWPGKDLPVKDLLTFLIDAEGTMWVGTGSQGIYQLNKDKGIYKHHTHRPSEATSLSSNFVSNFFIDKKQQLWIGTKEGLNRYNRTSRTFSHFTTQDGLPHNFVLAIQEDDRGNFWLGTNDGLARFNPDTKVVKNYIPEDGIEDAAFRSMPFKTKTGELLFGGSGGMYYFHPDSLKENAFIPPVYITDFRIFNQSVSLREENSVLDQNITTTKEITLSYDQSVFSFDFIALNYKIGSKNQYAYQMQGFDKKWVMAGNKRTATYTNLDPGEYTFRVKASNNDGIWNEKGTSIKIIITPPFWQTWWFRTLVALAVIGSALGYYKMKMRAIKAQKAELEKQVKERTNDLLEANHELVERQEEIMQQQEELQTQAELLQDSYNSLKETQEEIEAQRDTLQLVNENVMSSIQYARTIQRAILPSQNKIALALPQHFVLYRPKDVVSGDFYWFTQLAKEDIGNERDIIFIAAVDCTGHGVPGAFMSIIGNTLLNEIVNQKHIIDPAQVLELLNEGVKKAVEKAEGMNTAGMDVCLVRIEKEADNQIRILYSGAKRPLLFVREGEKTVERLEGDRRSIGSDVKIPFTTKEIILEANTVLYLTTDGYADQNNPAREKLGSVRLRDMMTKAASASLVEQQQIFEKLLDDHQQSSEQRDDITLIGVRV